MSIILNTIPKTAKIADAQIAVGTSANLRQRYTLQTIMDMAHHLITGYDLAHGRIIIAKLPKPERDTSSMVHLEKLGDVLKSKGGIPLTVREGEPKQVTDVTLSCLASGEEREFGIVNGQTRYLAARLLAALGYDVALEVQIVEYDAGMSAKIDNDERLLRGHERAELLARAVMVRSSDLSMKQSDLGKALGFTLKDRTRLQWLDAASEYCLKHNDTRYQDIDSAGYKYSDFATFAGKVDKHERKEAVKEVKAVELKTLELAGFADLCAVIRTGDSKALLEYGNKVREALTLLANR